MKIKLAVIPELYFFFREGESAPEGVVFDGVGWGRSIGRERMRILS